MPRKTAKAVPRSERLLATHPKPLGTRQVLAGQTLPPTIFALDKRRDAVLWSRCRLVGKSRRTEPMTQVSASRWQTRRTGSRLPIMAIHFVRMWF